MGELCHLKIASRKLLSPVSLDDYFFDLCAEREKREIPGSATGGRGSRFFMSGVSF